MYNFPTCVTSEKLTEMSEAREWLESSMSLGIFQTLNSAPEHDALGSGENRPKSDSVY